MNFLAHLHLADPGPPGTVAPPLVLVGNLMPDLVRGRLAPPDALPPEVVAGITRHRLVDRWTDTHPAFAATRRRLTPTQGRFAGVVTDVLYDRALADCWADFHDTPLPAFIADCYDGLTTAEARAVMPPRMRAAIDMMVEQDWLGRYRSDDGLRETFRQMSERFSQRFGREIDLEPAVDDLAVHRADIADDFGRLFPDLIRRCGEPG